MPLGHVADRHLDRRAGIGHLGAPDQAVGGLHRDRAHDVVADVLLDLERQRPGLVLKHDVHVQRVVDLRQVLGRELDVHDGAGDPGHTAGARGGLAAFGFVFYGRGHVFLTHWFALAPASALAPPTISLISWVISACRALFASRVSVSIRSFALSVAAFIARRREASSDAAASSSA